MNNVIIVLLIVLVIASLVNTKQVIEYYQNPERYRRRHRRRQRRWNRYKRRLVAKDNIFYPYRSVPNHPYHNVIVDYAPGFSDNHHRWWNLVDFSWMPHWFLPCKTGCTVTGNGGWGCQFPGYGSSDCKFASDCTGCN